MLDNTYKNMMNQISPSKELVEHVSLLMKSEIRETKTKKRVLFRKPIAIALICVCIVLSVPVMANNIPLLNKILYSVASEVTHFLQPIEVSSQDNGIKMDVLAAMNDDDMAVVYLTLQDLTGKRFDDTLDLYNYNIQGYRSFTHELVHFDDDTNTATLRMIANGGEKLNGKKISFNLHSFLSNKVIYNDVFIPIDMNNINNTKTLSIDPEGIYGDGGYNGGGPLEEHNITKVLEPKEKNILMDGIDFVTISSVGYIDGLLHIQTEWKESVDNHGFITLRDKTGNDINPMNLYFDLDDNGVNLYGRKYIEYFFDIPESDLINYDVYGYFVENGSYTEGNWEVTFKIDAVNDRSIIKSNLEINGLKIDKLTVTSLGIQVVGKDEAIKDLNVEIINNDGEIIAYDSVISNSGKGIFKSKYLAELPVDIDLIKEIKINGVILPR